MDTPTLIDTLHIGRRRARGHRIAPAESAPALGLTAAELEEALVALGDREDLATGVDQRARLARVRAALERELGRAIA